MLKKLLNHLGLVRQSELTEEFLCFELAKLIGDPTEYTIEPDQEKKIFADLNRIYGFSEYLKATMARDMQRDFSSTADQRQLIRGAFARTAYLKGKMVEANKSLTKD